jgi:hypothetical protein
MYSGDVNMDWIAASGQAGASLQVSGQTLECPLRARFILLPGDTFDRHFPEAYVRSSRTMTGGSSGPSLSERG